jgi:orotidine-5'-phosphate decarboxylase
VSGKDRVIFALDVDHADEARQWVRRLSGEVGVFKIGLELFVSAGPSLVEEVAASGERVFLDLKFHDIPNTVAGAVRAAGKLGAFLINVHAAAGPDALARCADAARDGAASAGKPPPKVIAVTVLTSHTQESLSAIGCVGTPAQNVTRLAALTRDAGLDGVVCSPEEVASLRAVWPQGLLVTPGIRPAGSAKGDQARIATPAGAVSAGADYLVVGRPIRDAADPREAARAIAAEIDALRGGVR